MKNIERLEEFYNELENGYSENLVKGNYADKNNRNTTIVVKRETVNFVGLFICNSYFDGKDTYNTEEQLETLEVK